MNNFDFSIRNLSTNSGSLIKYYSLNALEENGYGDFSKMPKSVKVLLESLVRMQSHPAYTKEHVEQLSKWSPDVKRMKFLICRQEYYCRILREYHAL